MDRAEPLSEERFFEAEMIRLHGELLEMDDRRAEAEQTYLRAVEVARQQEAKTWELRTAVNLSQLWHQEGDGQKADSLLRGI